MSSDTYVAFWKENFTILKHIKNNKNKEQDDLCE